MIDENLRVLLEPLRVGSVELSNRMAMAPVVTNAAREDGTVTDKMLEYYKIRATGLGLVVVESNNIQEGGQVLSNQLEISEDRFIPGLRRLAQGIQSGGAKALIQLNHGGAKVIPTLTPVSASDIPVTHGLVPRSMSAAEIREVVTSFGDAAVRAAEAGFDGVDIQACHFYLLSQFLSGYTNRRTDAYGGDIRGRMRFLLEVVEEIRSRIGSKMLLSCRIHAIESFEEGLQPEEIIRLSRALESSGVDLLSLSGVIRSVDVEYEGKVFKRLGGFLTEEDPPGAFVPAGSQVKKAVSIPVMVVGKIFRPAFAAGILHEQKADLIAFARQLIVNPRLAEMIRAGRIEDIEGCIECYSCLDRILSGEPIECAVNRNLWGVPDE